MTTGEVDKLHMMYIDAGFTTDDTNTTYILKGSQVWLFVNQEPVSSVGHAIADLFPGIPDNLDAAFVWSGNGRIYFVKVQLSVWVNLVKVQWSVWNYCLQGKIPSVDFLWQGKLIRTIDLTQIMKAVRTSSDKDSCTSNFFSSKYYISNSTY